MTAAETKNNLQRESESGTGGTFHPFVTNTKGGGWASIRNGGLTPSRRLKGAGEVESETNTSEGYGSERGVIPRASPRRGTSRVKIDLENTHGGLLVQRGGDREGVEGDQLSLEKRQRKAHPGFLLTRFSSRRGDWTLRGGQELADLQRSGWSGVWDSASGEGKERRSPNSLEECPAANQCREVKKRKISFI